MSPAISVLLPTIRPHLVGRAVGSIAPAAGSVSHEIIVVADFPTQALGAIRPAIETQCRWIQRERRGVIDAVNVACAAAQGEYWFLFNDESWLERGSLERLYREALASPGAIVTPQHLPPFPFVYYGKPFAPFPFVHRDTVAQLGGLLDPAFKGFYADPDFSLRAHAAGVPIRTVHDAILRHANRHDAPHEQMVSDYLLADRATFRSRWDHLGEFADP